MPQMPICEMNLFSLSNEFSWAFIFHHLLKVKHHSSEFNKEILLPSFWSVYQKLVSLFMLRCDLSYFAGDHSWIFSQRSFY